MAKAKKTRSKTKTKAKPKTRGKAKPVAVAKRAGKKRAGKAKGGSRQATEVERTWREYWQCRTELEQAVTAVQEADKSLASARALESTCREVFDRTKNSLESLLEVEPASADRGAFDLTGHGLSMPELGDEP